MTGAADYKPVPPERIYLKPSEWDRLLEGHAVGQFTSFDAAPDAPNTIDLAGRRHEGFARRARRRASTCSTSWPST